MRKFAEFMEKNREKAYAIAHENCKHDKAGHCLVSKNDAWMKETCWDNDFARMEERHIVAN